MLKTNGPGGRPLWAMCVYHKGIWVFFVGHHVLEIFRSKVKDKIPTFFETFSDSQRCLWYLVAEFAEFSSADFLFIGLFVRLSTINVKKRKNLLYLLKRTWKPKITTLSESQNVISFSKWPIAKSASMVFDTWIWIIRVKSPQNFGIFSLDSHAVSMAFLFVLSCKTSIYPRTGRHSKIFAKHARVSKKQDIINSYLNINLS